jgi:CDP-4-dehydro-6-deoxyglucose reductase
MQFNITIKSTQQSFKVEEGELILDAALRQGIEFPYSCQSGICTSCKGCVYAGKYDYGDNEIYGIDPENDQKEALFCSAYAKSDMMIDHPNISKNISPFKFSCTVTEYDDYSKEISQIILKPNTTVDFYAGQYLEVLLDGKTFPLSIANNPQENILELHLQHTYRTPQNEILYKALKKDSIIQVRAPMGEAYLREKNKQDIIFVAGGSGFAPIKSMIEYAIANGFPQNIFLYWGVRSEKYLYFRKKLELWDKLIPNFNFTPVISEQIDKWNGRKGLVHKAVLEDFANLSEYQAYLAGPFDMAYVAKDEFIAQGMNEDNIYSDAFSFSN